MADLEVRPGEKFVFRSSLEQNLWKDFLLGQMSDGAWENKRTKWEYWHDLPTEVDTSLSRPVVYSHVKDYLYPTPAEVFVDESFDLLTDLFPEIMTVFPADWDKKPELTTKAKDIARKILNNIHGAMKFPKPVPAGEPAKTEERGMTKKLMEAADVYGALSTMESKLKKFIESADDPMSPMDAVAKAAQDIGARYEKGEVVTKRDFPDVNKINGAFAKVYGAFAGTREAAYKLAELVGESTKTSGPKKEPRDIGGMSNTDILKDVGSMAGGFQSAFRSVQEGGAKVLGLVKKALDGIDAGKTDGTAEGKEIVKAFLTFRDTIGPSYYAVLGGVARRINQLMDRFTREKPVMQKDKAAEEPKPEGGTVAENIKIPWEDEFPIAENSDDEDAVGGAWDEMDDSKRGTHLKDAGQSGAQMYAKKKWKELPPNVQDKFRDHLLSIAEEKSEADKAADKEKKGEKAQDKEVAPKSEKEPADKEAGKKEKEPKVAMDITVPPTGETTLDMAGHPAAAKMAPGLLQVERLVRKLKSQVVERLR